MMFNPELLGQDWTINFHTFGTTQSVLVKEAVSTVMFSTSKERNAGRAEAIMEIIMMPIFASPA